MHNPYLTVFHYIQKLSFFSQKDNAVIVGILKEIKTEENRVSMTPAGVEVMKGSGHTVLVEKGAVRVADSRTGYMPTSAR